MLLLLEKLLLCDFSRHSSLPPGVCRQGWALAADASLFPHLQLDTNAADLLQPRKAVGCAVGDIEAATLYKQARSKLDAKLDPGAAEQPAGRGQTQWS